ncbi:MAG: DUF4810 domain-containing protein [Janthinobacterium lividum]
MQRPVPILHCTARCVLAGVVAALSGCASAPQSMYHWGGYENQLYKMYSEPGQAQPQQQLEDLEAQVQQARAANRPLPPGFHAHLGYLYVQAGKADQARQELETEKSLYPESALYMDRLLVRLSAPTQQILQQSPQQTQQQTRQQPRQPGRPGTSAAPAGITNDTNAPEQGGASTKRRTRTAAPKSGS